MIRVSKLDKLCRIAQQAAVYLLSAGSFVGIVVSILLVC